MNAPNDSTEPIRVVIVDDHPFYRDGLADLLNASGVEVVAAVPTGEAAISAVDALTPDVVVMDLNLPGMSGIEATRRLAATAPATRVLVLTVSAQEADVTDAIVAGASGYVLKGGVRALRGDVRVRAGGQRTARRSRPGARLHGLADPVVQQPTGGTATARQSRRVGRARPR